MNQTWTKSIQILLAASLIYSQNINAQTSAHAILDINNINARLNILSDHFSGFGTDSSAHFEVPERSGIHSLCKSALWIGGIKFDQLHVSAMTYRQTGMDFWAGPLNEMGVTNPSVAAQWDKIWAVTKEEVEDFKQYPARITSTIRDWPAKGNNGITRDVAPFVDVNGDGLYDSEKGDHPCMKGYKMLWWVFNDQVKHTESRGLPFGIEVHAIAYAFDHPTDQALPNIIFIEYNIINRGIKTIDSVYAGIMNDFDIGNPADDYVGIDTNLNTCYAYNGDNNDESTVFNKGYGLNPPVQGMTLLNRGIEYFISYNNDFGVTGNPVQPVHFYYYLTGGWKDGISIWQVRYVYPGHPADPVAWSEMSNGNKPGDRRGLISVKIGSLKPGQTEHLAFAYVFSRQTGLDHIGNFDRLRQDVKHIYKIWYNVLEGECSLANTIKESEAFAEAIEIYPNPALNAIALAFIRPVSGTLQVMNMMGQPVMEIELNNEVAKNIKIDYLASGVYLKK